MVLMQDLGAGESFNLEHRFGRGCNGQACQSTNPKCQTDLLGSVPCLAAHSEVLFIIPPLPRPSPKKLPNDCDFPIGMFWSPAGWLLSSGSRQAAGKPCLQGDARLREAAGWVTLP